MSSRIARLRETILTQAELGAVGLGRAPGTAPHSSSAQAIARSRTNIDLLLKRNNQAGRQVRLIRRRNVERDRATEAAADAGSAEVHDRHVAPRVEPQPEVAGEIGLQPRPGADRKAHFHVAGHGVTSDAEQPRRNGRARSLVRSWVPPTII